jgi:hypothetical protein
MIQITRKAVSDSEGAVRSACRDMIRTGGNGPSLTAWLTEIVIVRPCIAGTVNPATSLRSPHL